MRINQKLQAPDSPKMAVKCHGYASHGLPLCHFVSSLHLGRTTVSSDASPALNLPDDGRIQKARSVSG